MIPLFARLAISTALSVGTADLERKAARHVVGEYERIGRAAPQADQALYQAARVLAERALQTSASKVADALSVNEAVSNAGGSDPNPRALVIRASPPEQALESFLLRKDIGTEPANKMGVTVAVRGETGAVVALLASRKAELKPFPRFLPKPGTSSKLCGRLLPAFSSAELYVRQPGGGVDKSPLALQHGSFCQSLVFPSRGRYSVEVVGLGAHGPEVAALFQVDSGSREASLSSGHPLEPSKVSDARATLLSRINGLRKDRMLAPVQLDPTLTSVAQSYSEQMASQNFFAHVAPDGTDLKRRLQSAGYRYRAAGENLGLAAGAVAAEISIENSPGHLRNLIDERFTHLGIGIAQMEKDGRPEAIVTEILASPTAAPSGDPLQEAYRSLEAKRAELKLPPLHRSEALEKIALAHVRRALELNQPKAELPGKPLHERIFAEVKEIISTSVDFYVSESPGLITASKSLADRRNDRVGIGAVRGDSATYGKGKYWVVVIYAASR
jgi:uncharacterized protein YkwD